jgi:hypothetical protein
LPNVYWVPPNYLGSGTRRVLGVTTLQEAQV